MEEMQKSFEQVSKDARNNQSQLTVVKDPKTELQSLNDTENKKVAEKMEQMRKSVSLRSDLLDYDGRTSGDEYRLDYEYASSHNTHTDPITSLHDDNRNAQLSEFLQVSSNMINHESVFSAEEDIGENGSQFFGAYAGDLPLIKLNSLPFLDTTFSNLVHHSQSLENIMNVEKGIVDDSSDSCNYVGSAKDWVVPSVDGSIKEKNIQEDYSVCGSDVLGNKDFKIRRIEKWVMDLHYSDPLKETSEPINPDNHGTNDRTTILDCSATSRTDMKALQGTDAAKRYILSLSGSSSAANLANHGLVAIPLLSHFASVKELNLSGNAIVRITAGVLPKGLHILNLSKNCISAIEGLREFTRLRALDLSYNRILRIGHGLAACSSLRELYLAGNKISEVEGLHRLLKLKVLDLRFNKLSTTKSLGQLAANYITLLAIGVEGNPAQKNVGEENLKRYLTSLLPHLVYYNRHSIKSGSLKDPNDCASQLGIFDNGLRKPTHGRKSQAVSSCSRHVRPLPSGIKTMTIKNHHDFTTKRPNLGPEVVIRRTQSEGILLPAI